MCLCESNEKGIHCKEKWNLCEGDCNIKDANVPCSSALCKSGTCTSKDTYPFYECDCGDFFAGMNCEIENNPCTYTDQNPCLHGVCIFIHKLNRIICKCHNGWSQKASQNPSILQWGKQKVEVPAPCDEPIKKGLSKYVVYHTPVSYAMWWLVYVISVLVLFLCCCNLCFDIFSNLKWSYLNFFKSKKKE